MGIREVRSGICRALAALSTLIMTTTSAFALDAPHNYIINCETCHPPTPPDYWWTNQGGYNNTLCGQCHFPGSPNGDAVEHITTTKYGNITQTCSTCHQPHYQMQFRTWKNIAGGLNAFQTTARTSSVTQTTLTKAGANNWIANQWAGMVLVPNTVYVQYNYKILTNTDKTITIDGSRGDKINLVYAGANKTFGISFGKLVLDALNVQPVKFFGKTGPNSFADNDTTIDGVCQVCHAQTQSFNLAGILEGPRHPPGRAGTDCLLCHPHTNTGGAFLASCNACHGNPPHDGTIGYPGIASPATGITAPASAGAHEFHATTRAMQCEACHTGGMPANAIPSNTVDMGFTLTSTTVPNFKDSITAGTINARIPAAPYTGYTAAPGTTVNSSSSDPACSVYCHGSSMTPNGGTAVTPSWTAPGGAYSCNATPNGACHGASPSNPPILGSHQKHVGQRLLACTVCHADYAGKHVNGSADWSFDTATYPWLVNATYKGAMNGSATPLRGSYGQCRNTYCHSSAQGISDPTLPPEYKTPTWGQTITGVCGGGACHAVGYAHPSVAMTYTELTSGSHAKHLKYHFDQDANCQSCHYDPSYGGCTNCHLRTVNHVDHKIDVAFNPGFPTAAGGESGVYTGDATPGTAYGTCSEVYCHSQGTKGSPPYDSPNTTNVSWGGALPTDCTGCHNGDRNTAKPMNTGSHGRHILSYPYDCSVCHAKTVQDSRTLSPEIYLVTLTNGYRYHSNGWINIAFNAGAAQTGTYAGQTSPITYRVPGSAYGSCGNTYCHSNGTGGTANPGDTRGGSANNSPVWGSSITSCGACHGSGAPSGLPSYANGSPKANSHDAHSIINCKTCHWPTTQTGTSISNPANHANQLYDIGSSANSISYTYNVDGGSCSGTFGCHGTAQWGSAMSLDFTNCISCHKSAMGSRRQIVDSNGDGSGTGGDFKKTSHHVLNLITNTTCLVCHDVTLHLSGTVRLKDADNPETIYAYDPANPAMVENFCLSCHDANGAAGNFSPFSDGATLGSIPYQASKDIKDDWNKTYGHRRKGLTCLGSGGPNTGCHSNGHGSDYSGLLARNMKFQFAVGAPFSYDDYQLCFDCHGNYPAVTKEVVLGYKQGGNYDYYYAPTPYYTSAIQSKFRYRYAANNTLYPSYWLGVEQPYNDDFGYIATSSSYVPLHNWHMSPNDTMYFGSTWSYRGIGEGRPTCTACHGVHGSNTQAGWIYDQAGYTHHDGIGPDKYSTAEYADPNTYSYYPMDCAYNCHRYFGPDRVWYEPANE